MSPFRPLAVITSIFLAQAALAQTGAQEAEPPIDPQAVEILTSAADFLAAQPAFSFDWFVSYDDVIDGREKLTFTRSGSNLMSRDDGFYSFSQTGEDTREYFFDGSTVVIADVEAGDILAHFDNFTRDVEAEDRRVLEMSIGQAVVLDDVIDRVDGHSMCPDDYLIGSWARIRCGADLERFGIFGNEVCRFVRRC